MLRRAFTLIEILVIVIILGILAAITVPQFARATEQASSTATVDQLTKLRRSLAIYFVRNDSRFPQVTEGDGTWGELVGGGYMREAPENLWVLGPNRRRIVFGNSADNAFHTNYGWIFNPANGDVWAASFDANDQALPKP